MTPTSETLLVAGVVLVVLLAWAAFALTRLRRLDDRVTRAWDVLDGALARRTELAAVATRDRADQLGPDLAHALDGAVTAARRPAGGDREVAENALGRLLREVPGPVRSAGLDDAGWRVGLARRFYNDAVRDTRALRRRPIARVLRLHASRPLPRFFDIDDGLDAVVGAAGPQGAA